MRRGETDQVGLEWLTTVFDRHTKAKARHCRDYRLLITDGHGSHLNLTFLDRCEARRIVVEARRIVVAPFPSHSTHRLPPLKRRRKRQKPLKNYLLDLEDAGQDAPVIFSPAKIRGLERERLR